MTRLALPAMPVRSGHDATLNFDRLVAKSQPTVLIVKSLVTLGNGASGTLTKINPATVELDTREWWVAASHEYVPQEEGVYLCGVWYASTVETPTNSLIDLAVLKNGVQETWFNAVRFGAPIAGVGAQGGCSGLVTANGSTDTISIAGNGTAAAQKGNCALWVVKVA